MNEFRCSPTQTIFVVFKLQTLEKIFVLGTHNMTLNSTKNPLYNHTHKHIKVENLERKKSKLNRCKQIVGSIHPYTKFIM